MLISPTQALAIILARVRPLPATHVPVSAATSYYLAQDVVADRDQPPADRSAMDGFAVRAADVRPNRPLRLVGEVAAGSSARPRVSAGTCVGILTGAVIPPGADTVVVREQASEIDGLVRFAGRVPRGANIRKRGEEIRQGRPVLAKGTLLGPVQTGLCASVGEAAPRVHRRPRVAVICTGEELKMAEESVRPYQLRDSNGPALYAALTMAGLPEVTSCIAPDNPSALAAVLKAALAKNDVLLITGGVSVGKYDFVPEALARVGAIIHFHGVAMKPGRPQLYATVRGNRHIFGLPGNPLSALAGFHCLVLPALRRLSGAPLENCRVSIQVPLARSVRRGRKRVELVLARLVRRGVTRVKPLDCHGSADLVSAAQAHGLLVVGKGEGRLPAGSIVEFIPWMPLT
jgi:molybdenum cofactor synthesis domain-containing protein